MCNKTKEGKTKAIADMCDTNNKVKVTGTQTLTLSTPAGPNCCCLKGPTPYWSYPPFLIFDIRAIWRSGLSARAPECQKLKMVGKTGMAKCKALTGSAVKGLNDAYICGRENLVCNFSAFSSLIA